MGVPVVLLGEGLVDAVVEVLVVGEDDMATDVVELAGFASVGGKTRGGRRETHEAFGGDISGSQATRSLVGVNNHPRWAILELEISWAQLAVWYGKLTIWFRRFAAPRPVGPAPMTRTSTLLCRGELDMLRC